PGRDLHRYLGREPVADRPRGGVDGRRVQLRRRLRAAARQPDRRAVRKRRFGLRRTGRAAGGAARCRRPLPGLRRPPHAEGRLGHPASVRRARRAERPVEEARGVTAPVARFALLLALAIPARTAVAESGAPATTPATPAAPEIPPRKDVGPLVKQVFETGFEFCTNPGYPLTRDELKWCDLLSKSDARCPQLAKACTRGATAELVGQQSHKQTTTISMPTAQLPVRMLLWIVLGVVVAFLIYTIAKQTLGQRAPDREEAVEVVTEAPEDPALAAARIVETDVQRLLERARAAAAQGDYEGGISDAYAALLRKLEGAGV